MQTYLNSKPRYEILDGLRGVAAFVILTYHFFEGCHIPLGHGYLGVDFFYALSGFVIGYAYNDRWDRMSIGSFFKRRIVRLHPMVIMGGLFGLIFYYPSQGAAFPFVGQSPWWVVLLLFVYTSLMLPMPNSWDIRGWQDYNSFNGNSWSLLWEYVANILYAVFFRFLPTALLGVLLVVAALGTIDLTCNINVFGLLDGRIGAPFTVNGGWSLTTPELYVAVVRLFYPFLVGLLLSRVKCVINVRGAFGWCSLMVAALLLMPQLDGLANGIYEAIAILLVLPLIVSMGAGSVVKGKLASRICTFLGELSYPLYITHISFVYLQLSWIENHPDAATGAVVMLTVTLYIASIAAAYAALKLYDIPVRKWLTEKWLKRSVR